MEQGTNLVWIDLEMTGLNPERDVILEIATIITDDYLNLIEEGPSLVVHHSDDVLGTMDTFVRDLHAHSGLLHDVMSSLIDNHAAQEQTLSFLQKHCKQGLSPLCGNSIWQDRQFLAKHMPSITNFLHYRMIDVTAVKELIRRWYQDDAHALFKKTNAHRALNDIRESIAELRHYKRYFFV